VDLSQEIEKITSYPVKYIDQLNGGCIGQVFKVFLVSGEVMVAKTDERQVPGLDCEGYMLQYLAECSKLPVPEVYYNSPRLLLMSYIPGESRFSALAQEHAAELLADLHQISAPAFGLERDTLIGGMHQPNPWTEFWIDFFRTQRLLFMANEGVRAQRLPNALFRRIQRFCEDLEIWLVEPERPSLIHGDVWTTNVLAEKERIVGFVDPAIYFADPEIELAFTTLFGTFSEPFFARYQEIYPLRPGFFEERRDIYNLYPLLVHVRLFGGSYVQSVDATLARFGF
jgi:fructosamine-3-kinase